jgi:hypothetical protein
VGLLTKNIHEFRFKNTGTGVLKIQEKIDTTCGCAAAALSRTEYAPGQEGTIKITYTAGGLVGSALRHLTVHSNDKTDGGTAILTIKATVVERVAYGPKRLGLRLKGSDANCPPITLRSLDQRSFAVTGIVSSGSAITADVEPSRQATEFTFRPTLDPQQLRQHPTGAVVLALTHPECSEIRIPYQLVSEYEFHPSTVVLFNVEPNRPIVMRDVSLSGNYGEEFEIASCTSAAHMVTVLDKEKLVSDNPKEVRYRLRLSIVPPSLAGEQRLFEDTLVVHLTNGTEARLPCRVFYREVRPPLADGRVSNR